MNSTETTSKKSRNPLIIVLASVITLGVIAAIAVPAALNHFAVQGYKSAAASHVAAQDAYADVQADAQAELESANALLAVAQANPEMFSQEAIDELQALVTELAGLSTGVTRDRGNPADEVDVVDLGEATAGLSTATADLESATAKLTALLADLDTAELAVLAAGVTSGEAFARPEKATEETWTAYTASLEAMKADNLSADSDRTAIATTYVDARKAVTASHDAAVAAEAAAAQAAPKPSGSTGGASGGSSNGSSGNQIVVPRVPNAPNNDIVYVGTNCVNGGDMTYYRASQGWTQESAINHCQNG